MSRILIIRELLKIHKKEIINDYGCDKLIVMIANMYPEDCDIVWDKVFKGRTLFIKHAQDLMIKIEKALDVN